PRRAGGAAGAHRDGGYAVDITGGRGSHSGQSHVRGIRHEEHEAGNVSGEAAVALLKMHTDEGLVGLGEPILEGRARTVAEAVAELGEYLIGQDPRRIEHHWQAMYRHAFYRGGPILTSALSGVEQAMWDILGQSLGVPV